MNISAGNAAKHLNIWPEVSQSTRPNVRNAEHHIRKNRCQRSAPAEVAGMIHLHARPAHVQREHARWDKMTKAEA